MTREQENEIRENIVGMTIEKASDFANELNSTIRVMRRNDEEIVVTMEQRPNRFNVATKNDVIVQILEMG